MLWSIKQTQMSKQLLCHQWIVPYYINWSISHFPGLRDWSTSKNICKILICKWYSKPAYSPPYISFGLWTEGRQGLLGCHRSSRVTQHSAIPHSIHTIWLHRSRKTSCSLHVIKGTLYNTGLDHILWFNVTNFSAGSPSKCIEKNEWR